MTHMHYITRMMQMFLVFILLTIASVQPLFSQGETIQPIIATPSPNDVRELLRLLSDEQIQNWLKTSAEIKEPENDSKMETIGLRDQLSNGIELIRARLGELNIAWQHLSFAPEILIKRLRDEMSVAEKVRTFTYMVIFLFVGAGFEWLYRQYTATPLLRLSIQSHDMLSKRVIAAFSRAAIILFGLALFALGCIGAFLSFDWPPLVEVIVLNFLITIFAIRVAQALSKFFFAPKVTELRLVPLSNKLAKYFYKVVIVISSVLILAIAISDLFVGLEFSNSLNGDVSPETLSVMVFASLCVLITVLVCVSQSYRIITNLHEGLTPRGFVFWRNYFYLLVLIAYVLWLIGAVNFMWGIVIVGLLSPSLRVTAQVPQGIIFLPQESKCDSLRL